MDDKKIKQGKDMKKNDLRADPSPDGTAAAAEVGEEEASEREKDIRMRLGRLPSVASRLWREYRRNAKAHIREGAVGLALGLCAYLLGSCTLLFGTSPLGMALLCASPKKILWMFIGLSLSALSLPENGYVYIFAYATALAVRLLTRLLLDTPESGEGGTVKMSLTRGTVFGESIYLRMATGAASAFVVGIYVIISGSFEYYDLFGAIFSILCVPIAVFVYSGCFEESKSDKRFREAAIGALMVSLTFSLRDMYLVGISAGAFFAYFVTVYVCRQSGIWKGALIGLLCGLAYSPEYSPLFALAGITVGTLWNISAFGSLVAGGTAGMLWGFYVEGVSAMSRLLPAIMLASVCYMGARKLTLFPAAKDLLFSGRYCSDMNDQVIDRESREEAYQRLADLSDTFGSLSEIFYNLGDRLSRPGLPELRRMCDGVYDKYCPLCPSRNLCWELEYSSSKEILTSISKRLGEVGVADSSDIPEYMRSRCVALPGIIGEINHGCAKLCRATRLADKTEVFAMDYDAVSRLLADVSNANKKDYAPDRELTARLESVLTEYGFGKGGVSAYGDRRKRMIARGFDISKGSVGTGDLKKSVEKVCGFPVSEPVIEFKENVMTLRMSSARRLRAESVILTDGAEASVCGDTVSTFENCDDRYYAIISDGMGTGDEASFTSSVSSMFLQKMLGTGNGSSAVIKMLNSFIRSKPGECSSTVDLLELDLLTGRASFIKCGAATSFVRRSDKVFRLSAATLPLGILDTIDAGRLSFDAEAGDVIVMLSDGVAMEGDDCDWLLEIISTQWEDDPSAMAKKLVARAREKGSRDDISVILTRVDAV